MSGEKSGRNEVVELSRGKIGKELELYFKYYGRPLDCLKQWCDIILDFLTDTAGRAETKVGSRETIEGKGVTAALLAEKE